MSPYSTDKICAVVVPESVEKCHDILSASSNLVMHTPCPLGLSIYTLDEDQSYQMSLQPLISVSEQAARDRAPERHVMNGMGVKAGWYLIARPVRFKVHASYVNRDHYGLPWEDALRLWLEVDGQGTNEIYQYDQNWHRSYRQNSDVVFRGYVDKEIPSSTSTTSYSTRRIIRPFSFESTSNTLEGKTLGPTDIGTITLKIQSGVLKRSHPPSTKAFIYSEKQVSAKAIAREGQTMKVSQKQAAQSRTVRYSRYTVAERRNLPEAEITIYVRERSWLRSRRLIDDDDQPITYGAFRKLLKENERPVKLTQVRNDIVDVDEEPPKKRPKIKEQIALYDELHPIS